MVIRTLPECEWERLKDHPLLEKVGLPIVGTAHIIVAEDKGNIVGFQVIVMVPHVEPIWIDESYRGTTLAPRLFKEAVKVLDDLHINRAFCNSDSPEIDGYLERLHLKLLPYKTYLYDPKDEVSCLFR